MVSSETPSQVVPSFDHRVTQCRSTVGVSVGNSRNDLQSHRRSSALFSSRIVNSQRSSGICGVGPADNTGKSVVRYCPGGRFAFSAVLRPEKPREMTLICNSPMMFVYSVVREVLFTQWLP